MRHKKNKLKELNTGAQKMQLHVRNLVTNLVKNGQVKTTPKRAKILKSETDKMFSHLVGLFDRYEDQADVRRLCINYVKGFIMSEQEGKKIVNELVPKYREKGLNTGFVQSYKMGFRKGDGVEEILVKLV